MGEPSPRRRAVLCHQRLGGWSAHGFWVEQQDDAPATSARPANFNFTLDTVSAGF